MGRVVCFDAGRMKKLCLTGNPPCYSVFREIHVFVFSALLRPKSLVVIFAGRVSLGSENKRFRDINSCRILFSENNGS